MHVLLVMGNKTICACMSAYQRMCACGCVSVQMFGYGCVWVFPIRSFCESVSTDLVCTS